MLLSSCRWVSAMFSTRSVRQKHSLVPALQILQQVLRFAAVGGKVGRDNVHVVPLRTAFFCSSIFMRSRSVILRLTVLMAFTWSIRLNVQIDDNPVFHIQKISQHTVIQLRRKNLQGKETAPNFLPMRNMFAGRNSKDGAIKSLVDSPDGASQSHSN